MLVKVKLLDGFMPERQHLDDAGLDLRAAEDACVWTASKVQVRCGICLEIPSGFEGQVRSRSGLAHKHGIFVLNSPGTIDAGYRGEIIVCLMNLGAERFDIKRGDRIAQLVIHALPSVVLIEAKELDVSERGVGGFGSTGT